MQRTTIPRMQSRSRALVCLSLVFSCCCDKNIWQRETKGGSVYFMHSSRSYSPSWLTGRAWSIGSYYIHRQEAQRWMLALSQLLPSHSSVPQLVQWCCPHLRWVFQPLLTQSQNLPHWGAQKLASWLDEDPVKWQAVWTTVQPRLMAEDGNHSPAQA